MGLFTPPRRAWALACLLSSVSCGTVDRTPDHLVVVLFDTLRADRMSLYGHERPTTPFLDSIREELLVFEDFKAVAPWTLPTHATIFTGALPSEHRAQWGSMKLGEEATTLAETLAGQGFCTYGFSANPLVKPGNGLGQGFTAWENVGGPWTERTTQILERLPGVLEQARSDGCRLFLFLNLMDTHIPYNTAEFGADFGVSGPGPIKNAAIKWAISAGKRELSDEEWSKHRAAYDASVRAADDAARKVVEALGARGLLDETLLVLTSDHGDGLGFHPEVGHSISVWEEQLAIPLAVRFPDGGSRAGRIEGPRGQQALAGSILDWMRLERSEHSVDLPNLTASEGHHPLADYRSYFTEGNRGTNVKVADNHPELAERIVHQHVTYCGDLKLISGADGSRAAYDLRLDPDEQQNLLANGSDPRIRSCTADYRRQLRAGWLTPFDIEDRPGQDEPDLDALRSLGYVQ